MPTPAPQPGSTDPGDIRPYLCIPYWEAPRVPGDPVDIGVLRPLPSGPPPLGVVSWECPGIHAGPFSPGANLDVTVDVRNSGGGSATAIVTLVVYWAIPTVGFSKPTVFGATTVAVPPMRDPSVPGFVSASFSGVIPASAPDHICLLAVATHALDAAGTVVDPVNDRHWAQHNLLAVTPKSYPFLQSFLVANPFQVEHAFSLRVQQMDSRSLEAFALRHRFEPGQGQVQVLLLDGVGRPVADGAGNAQIRLTLGPDARQAYALRLAVQPPPAPHQVVVVEVYLYTDQERPVGSLGIVINGSG